MCKYAAFLFLFLLPLLVVPSSSQNCSKNHRKLDETVAKIMTIGNSGRKFPESKGPVLLKYCNDSLQYVKEMEGYIKNCLKSFNKQTSMVFSFSLKNAFGQLCKRDSKKLTLLVEGAGCINKANVQITRCYSSFIDSLLGSIHAPDKDKVPHVCCEYSRLYPCVEKRTRRVKGCDEEKVMSVLDFIKSVMGNIVDSICGDYDDGSDKCDKLGRPPKKLKSQKRPRSFILPMIEMFESFPEA